MAKHFSINQILRSGIRKAKTFGFDAGIVTNACWATSDTDAIEWLEPFAGLVDDCNVDVSTD